MDSQFTVVTAVNNDLLYDTNLGRSPMIARGFVRVIVERGHSCMGEAYNSGLRRASSDIVVFAHQDVYLPAGWLDRLRVAISRLERFQVRWGVIGAWGVRGDGKTAGRLWCTANGGELRGDINGCTPVISLDEVVLVLNVGAGLWFDEHLPSFHLYGTDIVQEANRKGLLAFADDLPVIHNSRIVGQLDGAYRAAYHYMQHKWARHLPIPTCVVPITRRGWPLVGRWLRVSKQRLLGTIPVRPRRKDVRALACALGYEQTTEK